MAGMGGAGRSVQVAAAAAIFALVAACSGGAEQVTAADAGATAPRDPTGSSDSSNPSDPSDVSDPSDPLDPSDPIDGATDDPAGATPTTEVAPSSSPVVAGPGILDLLGRSEGRVEVMQIHRAHLVLVPSGTADFHDGGRVLRFDRHRELDRVVDEYRRSVLGRSWGMDPWARPVIPDGDPTVQRAALVDVVSAVFLPADGIAGIAGPDCVRELAAERARFLTWAPPEPEWERGPEPGTQSWSYPTEAAPRAPRCLAEVFGEGFADQRVRFDRDLAAGWVDLLVDPGHQGDHVAVVRFQVVGRSPAQPAPEVPTTTVFDPATVFLLVVNRCGALPWAYGDIDDADTYTAPDDPAYAEPGPFTNGYACAADVPDGSRR